MMSKIISLLLISLVLSGCSSNQGFPVYPKNEREEFDHIYRNIREIQGKLDALIETNPNTKTKIAMPKTIPFMPLLYHHSIILRTQ